MFFPGLFLAFHAVGFALLAFLPRWRWLLPGGALAFALSVWAWDDVQRADGPGVIVAIPVVFAAMLGFASGFAARALLLLLAATSGTRSTWRSAGTLAAFFAGAPALIFAWSTTVTQQAQARRVPPSAECMARLHPAILGDTFLALPLAPNIRFGEGYEYQPAHSLRNNEDARRFCAGGRTPRLTNLQVELEIPYHGVLAARQSAFCARRRRYDWWEKVCRDHRGPRPPGVPTDISVYALGAYNASRMHAFTAEEATRMSDELARLPSEDAGDGVRKFPAGHSRYFTRLAPSGYFARCHASPRPDAPDHIGCTAGYPLSNRLGIIYHFETGEAAFPASSRQADAIARAVFDSLKRR